MSYRIRWMPLAPEVHAFQTEIGGDQRLVTAG